MSTTISTGGHLLQLRWSVPPDRTADFASWYDEEHLADMVAVPGILGGRRFVREPVSYSSPTGFDHLTLYQLDDLAPLSSPEFQQLVVDPSPWTRRVAFDLPLARTVYRARHPGPTSGPAGSALLHVMMSARPEAVDEFHAWYDEEHLPAVVGVPGVLSGRRFEAVDDGAGYGRDESEAGLDFLTVYELADVSVATSEILMTSSAPSARRRALGDAVSSHVQVYRQVFPAEGALET